MRALIQRVWQGIVVVAIVATATFVLVRLAPGDPFAMALENPRLTPELRAQWRAAYGLDGSIGTQYVRWISALLHGDLGWSIASNQPVAQAIGRALPNTLALMSTRAQPLVRHRHGPRRDPGRNDVIAQRIEASVPSR